MEFVHQSKSSIHTVNVIGQYVATLKKSGRDTYKGLCRFIEEKTRHLTCMNPSSSSTVLGARLAATCWRS